MSNQTLKYLEGFMRFYIQANGGDLLPIENYTDATELL